MYEALEVGTRIVGSLHTNVEPHVYMTWCGVHDMVRSQNVQYLVGVPRDMRPNARCLFVVTAISLDLRRRRTTAYTEQAALKALPDESSLERGSKKARTCDALNNGISRRNRSDVQNFPLQCNII